jgi:hypothetical protein
MFRRKLTGFTTREPTFSSHLPRRQRSRALPDSEKCIVFLLFHSQWRDNRTQSCESDSIQLHQEDFIVRIPRFFLAAVLVVILGFSSSGTAGNPHSAYYSPANNRVFWFIQTSDTHIGASGSQDSDNLTWLVTQARQIISPAFIIVTGDLTDSTNGNWLGWPNGPHPEEWAEYRGIVDGRVTSTNYYDIPGNHDAYNDQSFSYYRANSVQGRATGQTQVSFVKEFPFGKYHFLGINTADNTGDGFSLFWPYGDYAGLDPDELNFIAGRMAENRAAALTLVFGHHPLVSTGNDEDTFVNYGLSEFLSLMDWSYSAFYGYGHTHLFNPAFFVPAGAVHEGFLYFNTASLGKSDADQYTIMAIDCNGISARQQTMNAWPAVVITAPVDASLGSYNPYAYPVPPFASNPIRALVFDANTLTSVQYRIDAASQWFPMTPVQGRTGLYEARWDASSLPNGAHTIEVKATSASGASSDTITTTVAPSAPHIWDTDGDARSDIAVWRPGNGVWYVLPSNSPGNYTIGVWGLPTDKPVPGDYDGDGKSDVAVWRPENGTWYVLPSEAPGTFVGTQWGAATDIPVPDDYDGDGKTDIAVYRPAGGTWFILQTSVPGTYRGVQWGTANDIAVPADYDGDGQVDIAVWRPGTGQWFIVPSGAPGTYISTTWGISTDRPVPGDHDGDGRADVGIYRPSTGTWFILPSRTPGTYQGIQWGVSGDTPVRGDFDGDGKSDVAVWRSSSGTWYLLPSGAPGTYTATQWGMSGDVPVSTVTALLGAIP